MMCLLSDIQTRNNAHWEHIASIANERYSICLYSMLNRSFLSEVVAMMYHLGQEWRGLSALSLSFQACCMVPCHLWSAFS